MRPINVVVAHRDPALTENFLQSIQRPFHVVETASCLTEIRNVIARLRAPLAIVDLELISFAELGELCREFPATAFVCTHRLADEAMWSQSLSVGAVDCCLASDLSKILRASDHYIASRESQAVAVA